MLPLLLFVFVTVDDGGMDPAVANAVAICSTAELELQEQLSLRRKKKNLTLTPAAAIPAQWKRF